MSLTGEVFGHRHTSPGPSQILFYIESLSWRRECAALSVGAVAALQKSAHQAGGSDHVDDSEFPADPA